MNDNDPRKTAATDDLKTDSDTDWGEDWESAFQAEDDLFFPDLDEPSSSASPPASEEVTPSPPPSEKTSPPPQPQEAQAETTAITPAGGLFGLRWLLAGLGGGLILMLIFLGIYLLVTDAPEPTAIKKPRETPIQTPAGTAAREVAPPRPRSVRIRLKPFLIPVKNNKGKTLREFLDLKLTLVVQLDPDQDDTLPPEQIVILRDSIYRFFRAIPSAELHRYALARGEMLKKTTRAISRDLHDIAIKSIIFEKYSLT